MKVLYCLERWSGANENASFSILKNITESAYTPSKQTGKGLL